MNYLKLIFTPLLVLMVGWSYAQHADVTSAKITSIKPETKLKYDYID